MYPLNAHNHVPIFVDGELMESCGIMPEKDVREKKDAADDDEPADDEGLNAFKDFLDNFGA